MPGSPDAEEASPCACTLLRKASRAVARRYEAALAGAGVSATQFAILRALERQGATSLSRLAETMVLERTSLYRALGPLEKQGLVTIGGSSDRRAKEVALSDRGRARIREALPHWQRAQREFVASLGGARWSNLARELDDLLFLVAPTG